MGQWDIDEPALSEEADKDCYKMGPKMAIKLFVYTLSKTTANCRMVSKNSAAFFVLPIMSCVRWQCLKSYSFGGC